METAGPTNSTFCIRISVIGANNIESGHYPITKVMKEQNVCIYVRQHGFRVSPCMMHGFECLKFHSTCSPNIYNLLCRRQKMDLLR